ncbi:annexin-like protein RJ4 [Carica papaya]|uniref:annexin-like protein RJ4 n=1 Tax=Carica papaya TaxID=3649 RepID=UPI000B8CF964|nr:annexin-like protein RJ4 [Carica papaya]
MASLVVPSQVSVVEDAEALNKAFKGWGTDEKTVIVILGHRNAAQRKQIRMAYEEIYQEDLIKRLESEISGDFEVTKPLIFIFLHYLRFHDIYALVTAFRYDGTEVDGRLANSEADILRDVIKDKEYNHEEVVRIVSTRSKPQLLATFNRYREEPGTSITKELLGESDNELAVLLYTAIRCLVDPIKYFEKVLRNSIKKIGTDEDALTRVIVTRAEKDLQDIKDLYYKKNSELLEHAVAKDTTGDYKHFLLTLLGKED